MKKDEIYNEDFSDSEKIIEEEGDGIYTIKHNSFKISKDKIFLFLVCFALTLATYLLGNSFGFAMLGLIIAIALGYIKELYDKYVKKTKFDWQDVAFDHFGSFFGVLVCAIIHIIRSGV